MIDALLLTALEHPTRTFAALATLAAACAGVALWLHLTDKDHADA